MGVDILKFVISAGFFIKTNIKWCVRVLFILLSGYFILTFFNDQLFVIHHVRYFHKNVSGQCVIPKHDPFDENIMKFFWDPPALTCQSFEDLVYIDSGGFLRYNDTAIGSTQVTCFSSLVKFDDDYNVSTLPAQHISRDSPIRAQSDWIQVTCKDSNQKEIYKQLLYNINFQKTLRTNKIENESSEHMSVLIFGVDAVSNLLAQRKIPKTLKYLREELDAYEFKGYTKIAENSFPNIHGLLTGEFPNEERFYKGKTIDNIVPFIWKNFSRAGYATMFAEDCYDMSIFNVVTRGFKSPPTNHYLRPYFLAAETILPHLYSSRAFWYLLRYPYHCYGNKKRHNIQIDYFKKFVQSYKGKRKFAFSWHTGISHNEPNHLSYGDADFVELFRWMKKEDHLKNTVLVFMSDHGSFVNRIRNTPVGRIEERMPIFSIVLPKALKKRRPALVKSVEWNSKMLVSHFDTYQTLKDILYGNYEGKDISDKKTNGISIFRPLPRNRTCQDANIPASYCPCYSQSKVSNSSTTMKAVARTLVDKINTILKGVSDICVTYYLDYIKDAQQTKSNFELGSAENKMSFMQYLQSKFEVKHENFLILIKTKPGNALFEANVVYGSKGDIQILEPISRNSRYGNQSHCVTEKRLKPFCLCKDNV